MVASDEFGDIVEDTSASAERDAEESKLEGLAMSDGIVAAPVV